MMLYYEIANLIVGMRTFGMTKERACPYRTEKEITDILIVSDWQKKQVQKKGLTDEEYEYLSTGASFYRQLLSFDGLMLHASAVVVDGYAYLFSAPCGTGKSTHTQLWLRHFGDRAYILNDDKPALRLEDGIWYAYGTPWSGKHDISVNARVPVGGICMLHRAEENTIVPFHGPQAILAVMRQTMRPADPELRTKLMELLDKLLTMVPLWQMGCNMDPGAALLSHGAMSRGRKDG